MLADVNVGTIRFKFIKQLLHKAQFHLRKPASASSKLKKYFEDKLTYQKILRI